jgi:phosphatidylserine decarboxylase
VAPRTVPAAKARLVRSSPPQPFTDPYVAVSLGVSLQHLLPKEAITTLAGRFARAELGSLTTAVIRWFVDRYEVQMHEAAEPDVSKYATFNDFFTRPLRQDARPLADAPLVCPVDGAVSACGSINGNQIFQAKGHAYTTAALLGGEEALAAPYADGSFATIYLSPRDYHRIHMPCDGRLVRMTHVPGALYSVNPATAAGIRGLFARNERVVCHFEGATGPFVMVLVGATIVGSMATAWHGVVNPPRSGVVRSWEYAAQGDAAVRLTQGAEMGRFLLGSTVVLLFPSPRVSFNVGWAPGRAVRMGEPMAMATGDLR